MDENPQKRKRTDDAQEAEPSKESAPSASRKALLAAFHAQKASLASQAANEAEGIGQVAWQTPEGSVAFVNASEEQADDGQDFDHELNSNEYEWESQMGKTLPPGWAHCRNFGQHINGIIPIKTPLGKAHGQHVPRAYQWKPSDVISQLAEHMGIRLGLIIDLTSTDRYYGVNEFETQGVKHIKLPCKGHSEVPQAKEVNHFYWHVLCYGNLRDTEWIAEKEFLAKFDKLLATYNVQLKEHEGKIAEAKEAHAASGQDDKLAGVLKELAKSAPTHPESKLNREHARLIKYRGLVIQAPKGIAVHCTHGYNRTGYMIVNYLMRAFPEMYSVETCIKSFAQARVPGIYKDEYIQALFDYYHEERQDFGAHATLTPLMPSWKPDDGSPELAHYKETENIDLPNPNSTGAGVELQHDDNIGEAVCEDEAQIWRAEIVHQVRKVWLEGAHDKQQISEQDYNSRLRRADQPIFPGSQPVSVSNANQALIYDKRYWFTWKADGTRYMMLIQPWGTYLIDRRFTIARVQARFPIWSKDSHGKKELKPKHISYHKGTLLDGEMVVDTAPDGTQRRIFFIYDLMMLGGMNMVMRPWKERFEMIREVCDPRDFEAKLIRDPNKWWPRRYMYAQELFAVTRKGFWPLHKVDSVFRNVIPNLQHENDGLILQSYHSEYVPDVCNDLLKWKPASHNSVDFKLLLPHDPIAQAANDQGHLFPPEEYPYVLGVLNRGSVLLAYDLEATGKELRETTRPARITFPDGMDPESLVGIIVECNWDKEKGVWCYMRERSKDKTTPNALGTYMKVVQSIIDEIEEEDIRNRFQCAYSRNSELYAKDIHIKTQEMHAKQKMEAAKKKDEAKKREKEKAEAIKRRQQEAEAEVDDEEDYM